MKNQKRAIAATSIALMLTFSANTYAGNGTQKPPEASSYDVVSLVLGWFNSF